jgi:hypothetical protein
MFSLWSVALLFAINRVSLKYEAIEVPDMIPTPVPMKL